MSFDARQTELVSCMVNSDCVLRAGVGCCANCSASGYAGFVALNREVTPRANYASTVLAEGDKVEIVRPMGGG